MIVLKIAYDGTSYWGWQKTGSNQSVEDALERALTQILQHPIQLEAASRLDRGVHARGQVAAFQSDTSLEPSDLAHRANCLLPPEIRITDSYRAPEGFHPTLNVRHKEYRYYIENGVQASPFQRHYAWHIKEPLDLEVMQQKAKELLGSRDFQVFCNQRKGLNYTTYERTLMDLRVEQSGDLIEIVLVGERFMYKMCRNIVGLLVGYGKGMSLPSIEELIEKKDRTLSYVTAPACGLFLHEVCY